MDFGIFDKKKIEKNIFHSPVVQRFLVWRPDFKIDDGGRGRRRRGGADLLN